MRARQRLKRRYQAMFEHIVQLNDPDTTADAPTLAIMRDWLASPELRACLAGSRPAVLSPWIRVSGDGSDTDSATDASNQRDCKRQRFASDGASAPPEASVASAASPESVPAADAEEGGERGLGDIMHRTDQVMRAWCERPTPASADAISALWAQPEVDAASGVGEGWSEQAECSVCYGVMYNPVTVKCGHAFCKDCLIRCLDHKPACPVCREDLRFMLAANHFPVTIALHRLIHELTPELLAERREVRAPPLRCITSPSFVNCVLC